MKRYGLVIVLSLSIVFGFAGYFVKNSDVSDFAKGGVAGIWIGLLLLAVIMQGKGLANKRK